MNNKYIIIKRVAQLILLSILTFIVFDLCVKGLFSVGVIVTSLSLNITTLPQFVIMFSYLKYVLSLLYIRFIYLWVTKDTKEEK